MDKEIVMDNSYMQVNYYRESNVLELVTTEQFNLDNVEDVNNLRDLYEFLRGFFVTVMQDG